MENKREIVDYNILQIELERKLYCIKNNNFIMNKEFKEKFGFEFIIINKIKHVISLNEKPYNIEDQSRIIEFIIDEVPQKRFIYSISYLQQVFNELNIEFYSTSNEKLDDDSIDSEICIDEIINIFKNEEINKIFKIKLSNEKIIDLFKKRYPSKEIEVISDLLINTEFYYKNNSKDNLDINIFKNFYDDLINFIFNSNDYILYLIGPKGTSKSLFLNYSILMYNMSYQIPSLYINYIKIKNLDFKKRKNIFKKEMIYLFFDKDNLKSFYQEKYHRTIISDKNIILCLKNFLQSLINIYKNTFDNKKIIIIIDNFDENEMAICDEMENIIKLVEKNSLKMKLIISGHSNFLNKKLKLFIEDNNYFKKNNGNVLFNYNLKIDTENEIKTLPAYYFRKDINGLEDKKIEKILLEEEIKYCDKFNILGMLYSILNYGNEIELKNILDFFNLLPIDYLNFEMKKGKVKFNFHNPIFFKAVKEKIYIKIQESSLLFLLKECENDQIIKGIYEEKLLTLAISYNKLGLKNLIFQKNNILEISKIANFKQSEIENNNEDKIINGYPIVINQVNFKGPNYDLLILFPIGINNKNDYISYFIQIGVNKVENQFTKILNDFNLNKNNYISGIENFIGHDIKITNAELLFIFDKDTQIKLSENNVKIQNFGAKYCINNNIKFYLFSIKDYCLYITFNMLSFNKVSEFGNFNQYSKRNWSMLEKEKFNFLTDEEIDLINSYSKIDIIKTYKTIISYSNIQEFPHFENENIYIIKNVFNKYYVINNVIYYLNNEKNFKKIDEKDIIKKENYNLYILIKKKIKKFKIIKKK